MRRLDYKWGVLISVIFGIFMVILDSTVVNVALATIREEFHTSLTDTQWVISLYTMALGISTPLAGFLGDRFGLKRIYVLGLILFVLGSLACGFAPTSNILILIVARAVQGVGGGISLPLGTALLFGAFKTEEQGLAYGIFGIALVVAPALGPILGGWLVDQDLWRFIFFINVPIGLLGIALASRMLREQRSERVPIFDWLGLVFSTIGFGSVLYAASIAADDGWTSTKVLAFFAIGGVGLLIFSLIELFVARDPLLDLRLFKRPVFLNATVVGYVSVVALFGAEFLLPLYLQTLRGKSALETGVILLPLALSSGVVVPLAGKLYDKVGARPLMIVGFGLLAINTWQFSQLTADTPIGWILALMAIRGVALGLTVQTTVVASLSVVTKREYSRASSLSNATRQVVQSIGVAVLATILATALSAEIRQYQNTVLDQPRSSGSTPIALCPPLPASIPTTTPTTGAPGGPSPQQLAALLQEACQQSIKGYENAYKLTFYFALLAMALGALLPGWPFKWEGRTSRAEPSEASGTGVEPSVPVAD
jgi:DHA2 family multidrug resistance protein